MLIFARCFTYNRTTDGVFCGRARGNVFNHADDMDAMLEPGLRKGRVHVYTSHCDPEAHKPDMSLTSEVSSTLKPILHTLARNYSPVRSKHAHCPTVLLFDTFW